MYWWLAYLALAFATGAASWRSVELRPVGIALVASCTLSDLATSYLAITERPAAYTVCEVMVLSMAFLAHVCGASRIMVGVVATAILSITFNICMTLVDNASHDQILLWQISTNLCFAVECALVLGTVAYDRARNRVGDGCAGVAFYGSAPASSEAER